MITIKPQEGLVADRRVSAENLARFIALRILEPEEKYAQGQESKTPDLEITVGPYSIKAVDETGNEVRRYTGSAIADQRARFKCRVINREGKESGFIKSLPVIVKTVHTERLIRQSPEEQNPHFGMSGAIMKLLQERDIRGKEKPIFPYAPFILSSTAEMQVMERLRGQTLRELLDGGEDKESGKITLGLNQQIEEEMRRSGLKDLRAETLPRRLEELLEQLMGMFTKAIERQAFFAQHLTHYQDLLLRHDDRPLRDPSKEEPNYVLRLLCGPPTEYGEQGYLPIMLSAAHRKGHLSGEELETLLSIDLSKTRGMQNLRRFVAQAERIRPIEQGGRKIYRNKVVSHGDYETDNILVGDENEPKIPFSFIDTNKPRKEEYFVLDFGRTRLMGNKDLATLLSDPSFRHLRSFWKGQRNGFDPIEINNRAIENAAEGIEAAFALEKMGYEGLWLPASLHNASRVAKKIKVAERYAFYTPLEEALRKESSEVIEGRLIESQGIYHHLEIFLESAEEGKIFGGYKSRYTQPLYLFLRGLEADITKLTHSRKERITA